MLTYWVKRLKKPLKNDGVTKPKKGKPKRINVALIHDCKNSPSTISNIVCLIALQAGIPKRKRSLFFRHTLSFVHH